MAYHCPILTRSLRIVDYQEADPRKLEQMQTLITELNRAKSQTWEARRNKSSEAK